MKNKLLMTVWLCLIFECYNGYASFESLRKNSQVSPATVTFSSPVFTKVFKNRSYTPSPILTPLNEDVDSELCTIDSNNQKHELVNAIEDWNFSQARKIVKNLEAQGDFYPVMMQEAKHALRSVSLVQFVCRSISPRDQESLEISRAGASEIDKTLTSIWHLNSKAEKIRDKLKKSDLSLYRRRKYEIELQRLLEKNK